MSYQIMLEAGAGRELGARACGPARHSSRCWSGARGAHPDREVFADGARAGSPTAGSRTRSSAAPSFLRRIGIKRGDVVTIQLPNRIDFPIVFFALELIGAVANKVNPDFRARELEYILQILR